LHLLISEFVIKIIQPVSDKYRIDVVFFRIRHKVHYDILYCRKTSDLSNSAVAIGLDHPGRFAFGAILSEGLVLCEMIPRARLD
jgi:hypothetical protein